MSYEDVLPSRIRRRRPPNLRRLMYRVMMACVLAQVAHITIVAARGDTSELIVTPLLLLVSGFTYRVWHQLHLYERFKEEHDLPSYPLTPFEWLANGMIAAATILMWIA